MNLSESWRVPRRGKPHVGVMHSLLSRATYVRELRPDLAGHAFERARSRLWFVPLYLAVVVGGIVALAHVPWFVWPVLSLAIGAGFAGLTFIAHEALHGAIARGRATQYAIGVLGFLPFCISPRLWLAWHNRDHHARANHHDDPDAYPTIETYRERAGARFSTDMFSLGGGRWRGGLSLIIGFTVQSAAQLIAATTVGFLSARERRLAIAETALMVGVWIALAFVVGPLAFVFAFVLPLVVANACVMAFILTNHSLSPRVEINDPLASGLTVTVPRLLSWLTLGFGYHVEHHLYPAMSTRHSPLVRAALQARYPERYHSMPLTEALGRLHRSARVYKTETTLCDPRTGAEFATL